MLLLATIGSAAVYLLFIWLASAAAAAWLADRKGYTERVGLMFGLILSAVGFLIVLVLPARPGSTWKREGALPNPGTRRPLGMSALGPATAPDAPDALGPALSDTPPPPRAGDPEPAPEPAGAAEPPSAPDPAGAAEPPSASEPARAAEPPSASDPAADQPHDGDAD